MKEIREYLLKAPDTQLDAAVKPLIEKWDEDPTPLQILEVLDLCIHDALASGFVVSTLQAIYDVQCKKSNTTHEEVEKLASWRKPPPPPVEEPEKDDPSAGLFTVECDGCKTVFPAENRKCTCGAHKGELKLNVDEMLRRVYAKCADEEKADGLDIVFDVFWNLHDKWDIMNEILTKADVSKLNESLMVGFMVQTFKYINKVPAHLDFCDRSAARMKELGLTDEKIEDLVGNYRETGDYWENMKAYGAPVWLTGPKPE